MQLAGMLMLGPIGEDDEALYLAGGGRLHRAPLAEELEGITNKKVTCRYWVTDREVTRDEAQDAFLKTLMGVGEARCRSHYSEITGYLWTDEDLNIGGHDLLAELKSHLGKWLILEIDVHI